MKIAETGHPFYKPLWRRLVIVVIVGLWAAYEIFVSKEPLWMALSAGMLAYAAWVFVISWPKARDPEQ